MEAVIGSADKALVEKWEIKMNACQQARINFERQWHSNIAFYHGRQWIAFMNSVGSNGGFMLSEPAPSYRWQVRHTANRIRRIIRTELTKLSKEEPQFWCMPKSTEESDRAAAMAGDAIAEFLIHAKYFNAKRMEATLWAVLCGTAFIKTYYDQDKTDIDGIKGAIDFLAVTPFHLLIPHLQIVDLQEQPYVGHVRTLDPETVYNAYGVEIQPTSDVGSTIMDTRFLQSIGIKNTKNERLKQCYVKEIWAKPCKEFPKGAMFVYGEGRLLNMYEPKLASDQQDPNQMALPVGEVTTDVKNVPKSIHEGLPGYDTKFPYRHNRFPFAKIDHVPSGMFYSDSVIKDLIPLQKEYNRTRSIMLERRNLASKPQWGYNKGSINPKHFNSKPGLLLAVNPGFDQPKPLEQAPLDPALPGDLDITVRDMDDASGQFEISKGRTPPGVEAASAIAYLQEENDTIFHHTITSLENAVQEVGVQALALVHDYWEEERIIASTSRNQAYEVRKFKGKDLAPFTDFRVESGSMAPRSKAAKQAFITELIKMQVITPDQGMKYLQMNETNKMYEEIMIDNRHAQRENMRMAEGQELLKMGPAEPNEMGIAMPVPKTDVRMDQMGMPVMVPDPAAMIQDPMTGQQSPDPAAPMIPEIYNVTVNPFDNHPIHIKEHESYQKTQEYEMLPPESQDIIQRHVDEHKGEILKERVASEQHQMSTEFPAEGTSAGAPPEQQPQEQVMSPNGY